MNEPFYDARKWPFGLQLVTLTLVLAFAGSVLGRLADTDQLIEPVGGQVADLVPVRIELADSVAVPISEPWLDEPEPGGVFAIRVANYGSRRVIITRIRPITDEGVTAEYLGWATCLQLCPGALRWTTHQASHIENTRDGIYPIVVAPIDGSGDEGEILPSLIFNLVLNDEAGERALRAGCLALRGIGVRFDNGSSQYLTGPSDLIGGIELLHKPKGYHRCFVDWCGGGRCW
jgi:hypothetical protein